MKHVQQAWSAISGVHVGPLVQVIVGLTAALMLFGLVILAKNQMRGRDLNAKKTIGLGVVQAGVTFIIVTGVYGFFRGILGMPTVESAIMAVFIQAAEWGAIGSIYAHSKGTGPDGKPNTGFGPAGPFFWFVTTGGGTLAVIASGTAPVAVGRIVIVCIGAYMWYLQLVQIIRRTAGRSRWRWTPKALLLAVGAIEPADEDVRDEAREWQIRKIARAIRWSNSRWPWSWFGGRALAKRAEAATADILDEGRRRYAEAHVLRTAAAVTSPVMNAIISTVQAGQLGEQIDAVRAEAKRAAEQLEIERAEHAEMIEAIRAEHAERSAAERAEAADRIALLDAELRMLRERVEQAAEQLRADRAEHAVQMAALRAEHAEQIAAVRAEQSQRSGTSNPRPTSRSPKSATPEQRTGAPRLTDEQAVAALLAEHPEHDYEWGSREVNRITKAGFGRIPKLIAMVAEHHARSGAEHHAGADRSGDSDDAEERAS